MPVVPATIVPVPGTLDYQGVKLTAWSSLANADSGDPRALSRYADRSVQVAGTFGVGGALVIEGTNDGANWVTLKDEAGSDLRFTTAGLAYIACPTAQTRPRVVSGDGTTALTVTLLQRGEV